MIELTCDQLEAHLTDYLDGTLDEALIEPATRHLAECTHCRITVDQTGQVRDLGAAYGRLHLDESSRSRIRQRLRDEP